MIQENKTLRWLESQNRSMDEIHRSEDTGLCNRIFHWQLAEFLNEKNNYEYTIYVGESYWPELNELIELPHTKIFNENETDDVDLKILNLTRDSKPLTDFDINNFILKNDFTLSENHLYSDFQFQILSEFNNQIDIKRNISNVKLKDLDLQSLIHEFSKDMVGIHIRRGRGVQYENDLTSLPNLIQSNYINYRLKEGRETAKYYIYEFIRDDVYFNIIDSILEINPLQKFYVSHDLPDDIFEYYINRYPNSIYTKTHFYDFIENRYKTPIQHVKNVIDLFSLSNTKFVIMHPLSTWSTFAFNYNNKKGVLATEPIGQIIQNYNVFL